MKIAIIGGGVMGEIITGSVLAKGLATPESIVVSDISEERRDLLASKFGVAVTSDNREALGSRSEVVVLAIKPQTLPELLEEANGNIDENQLVLSIVAGARTETISKGLNHQAVARAMPNIAAQIGEAVSVWTATKAVNGEQKETARSLLRTLGKEIYTPDEKFLDMATAVSGSGPAYVFLMIEALVDAAAHIGLPRDMAKELVLQTVLGAARIVEKSGKHPAELRNMVATPAGTTAEGLLKFEEGGLRAMMTQAVIAAYKRAQSLAGEVNK